MVGLLSGCGFTPLLQSSSKPAPVHVDVTGIEGYLNHRYYQSLTYKLGLLPFLKDHTYSIRIVLTQAYNDIGYGLDATALRTQNLITASYELYDNRVLIHKGKVDTLTSFNSNSNDEFSTMSSRMGSDEKVIEGLAEETARDIMVRIKN